MASENSLLLLWAAFVTLLLPFIAVWQYRIYKRHVRKVLFLMDAIENNDTSIHFNEREWLADSRLVNRALNRLTGILSNVKIETAQREKYYELILDSVNTGIVVIDDHGVVYQKNNEALRLLGLEIFTHVTQLARIDPRLQEAFSQCHTGEKLQLPFSNERATLNLSIRVSDIIVRGRHLRILALNDINSELDEKEIDSWIRLTRVLTHEIMNSVTPIASLSDTLLRQASDTPHTPHELTEGLRTISATGKSLLQFVDSYRRFTRIPTPMPRLFYVKPFVQRMVKLAAHQYPDITIRFCIDISPDDLLVHADENLITQVMTNLLKNAIQAIESTGKAEGSIGVKAYSDPTEAVVIEVSNSGPAISADVAAHIFIPFFTTKEGGSGIGLSISRQIMQRSGGSLTLQPSAPTTFVMRFD